MTGANPILSRLMLDSKPSPERDPERLALVGSMFGMTPAAPSNSRVLELGCGCGNYLLQLAALYPKSTFLGIDSAAAAIETAEAAREALALGNVTFQCLPLEKLKRRAGEFDFILCHGVFSWVSEEVRAHILRLCGEHLAPQGIAAISYNTLPGWNARATLRRLLQGYDDTAAPLPDRAQRARETMKSASDLLKDNASPHATQIEEEIENCKQQSDQFIFRELLSDTNEPFHISDVAANAARCGLAYLGDSRISRMRFMREDSLQMALPNLKVLGVTQPEVGREQVMDHIVPTSFRISLFCKNGAALNRDFQPARLKGFQLASALVPARGDCDADSKKAG